MDNREKVKKFRDILIFTVLILLGLTFIGLILHLISAGQVWLWLSSGSETIRNYALIVGGGAGIWIAYKRAVAHDVQANNSEEQIKILSKNQSTDIYSRAIEQLSSENLYSRVGAIYSLSKLAQDDPKDYLDIVIKNLSNFVKTSDVEMLVMEESIITRRQLTPNDVSVAFLELVKLLMQNDTYMHKVDLAGTSMPQYNFVCCDLSKTVLDKSYFDKSTFQQQTVFPGMVYNSKFREACFNKLCCKTTFVNCDFSGAEFYECDFSNILFVECDLSNAVITGGEGLTNNKLRLIKDRKGLTVNGKSIEDHLKNG